MNEIEQCSKCLERQVVIPFRSTELVLDRDHYHASKWSVHSMDVFQAYPSGCKSVYRRRNWDERFQSTLHSVSALATITIQNFRMAPWKCSVPGWKLLLASIAHLASYAHGDESFALNIDPTKKIVNRPNPKKQIIDTHFTCQSLGLAKRTFEKHIRKLIELLQNFHPDLRPTHLNIRCWIGLSITPKLSQTCPDLQKLTIVCPWPRQSIPTRYRLLQQFCHALLKRWQNCNLLVSTTMVFLEWD